MAWICISLKISLPIGVPLRNGSGREHLCGRKSYTKVLLAEVHAFLRDGVGGLVARTLCGGRATLD